MRTVRQAIDTISTITGEPRARVNQIARRLIDDGLLPKSSGRDIKEISPYHTGLMLSALALSDRIADAPTVARRMAELPSRVTAKGVDGKLCDKIGLPTDAPFGEAMGRVLSPQIDADCNIEFSRDNAGNYEAEIRVEAADRMVILHYRTEAYGHVARRSFILAAEGVAALRWLIVSDDA